LGIRDSLELALGARPVEIILDPHAVDDPALPDRTRHCPIFPAVAGVEVFLVPAPRALEHANGGDRVEQRHIGRLIGLVAHSVFIRDLGPRLGNPK